MTVQPWLILVILGPFRAIPRWILLVRPECQKIFSGLQAHYIEYREKNIFGLIL